MKPPTSDTSDASRPTYRLEDRYLRDEGRVFASGVQILARLPFEQLRRDRAAGRNTAAFVCGYPGSPLALFDTEITRVAGLAEADGLRLVHQPGLNEELAMAAVMGSQHVSGFSERRHDGVLGMWYGKAPGLDRACDAMRHAVLVGAAPLGGSVALVGDDPHAQSSTVGSSSDGTLVALRMPFLVPGDPQEVLDLGRHAIALSRACGVVTAMRIVAAVADGTGSVDLRGGDAWHGMRGNGSALSGTPLPPPSPARTRRPPRALRAPTRRQPDAAVHQRHRAGSGGDPAGTRPQLRLTERLEPDHHTPRSGTCGHRRPQATATWKCWRRCGCWACRRSPTSPMQGSAWRRCRFRTPLTRRSCAASPTASARSSCWRRRIRTWNSSSRTPSTHLPNGPSWWASRTTGADPCCAATRAWTPTRWPARCTPGCRRI